MYLYFQRGLCFATLLQFNKLGVESDLPAYWRYHGIVIVNRLRSRRGRQSRGDLRYSILGSNLYWGFPRVVLLDKEGLLFGIF